MHAVLRAEEKDHSIIAMPGPLFPNSFKELEELKKGGFYVYDDGELRWEAIELKKVRCFSFDCRHKDAKKMALEMEAHLKSEEVKECIVLLRFSGTLAEGTISDLNMKGLQKMLEEKGSYAILKNTSGLNTKAFEEITVHGQTTEEIEERLMNEHLGQIKIGEGEKELVRMLMRFLDTEKQEGETVQTFEERLREDVSKVIAPDG